MQQLIGQNWHALEIQKIIELFGSDARDGLNSLSIKDKEKLFGKNRLEQKK